tara:strand:- start:1383 stop:2729 length:1347 start_codon:yes stop_codon:yes gene_type:complete
MFGKKKKKLQDESKTPSVNTIPDIFYGGKDPEVYHKKQKQKKAPKILPIKEKENVKEPVPKARTQKYRPIMIEDYTNTKQTLKKQESHIQKPPQRGKKRLILVIGGIIVLLVAGGMGVWYYVQPKPKIVKVSPTPPKIVIEEKEPEAVEEEIKEEVVEEKEEEVEEVNETPEKLDFPKNIFIKSPDVDKDALTDAEEEVLNTDSGTQDTDQDGYYDGLEVANLYNPTGLAPRRIVDSGIVREYVSPLWKYRLYYPLSWQLDSVDEQGRDVVISAITGDYVQVRVFQKENTQTFLSWFAAMAKGQRFAEITEKTNRFKEQVFVRRDGLVAYVPTDQFVFVLLYNPGSEQMVLYPNLMNMIIQSFRTTKTQVEIPDQTILPQVTEQSLPTNTQNTTSTIGQNIQENQEEVVTTTTTPSENITESIEEDEEEGGQESVQGEVSLLDSEVNE